LNVTLVEQILALDQAWAGAGIPHAFGGALALAYAVEEVRATMDIDCNVFVAPGRVDAVLAALPAGVARSAEDRAAVTRDRQVRLWWERTPVDLFFSYHRFHDVAGARVQLHPLAGHQIPFLSATDLIVFKAFFSRPQDWVDIASVAQAGSADMDEALGWVRSLLGDDSPAAARLALVFAAVRSLPEDKVLRTRGSRVNRAEGVHP
jgi:hypothetical protein